MKALTHKDITKAVDARYPELAPFLAQLQESLYDIAFYTTLMPEDSYLPLVLMAADKPQEGDSELHVLSRAAAIIGAATHDAYLEACATGFIDVDGAS